MQPLPLGRTGLNISPIVFGGNVFGWTVDETTSHRLLSQMLEAGLTTIDTADAYSRWVDGHSGGESETVIGNWLAANPGMRDRITLITKVGSDMGAGRTLKAAYIEQAVERSLSRLKTDYIDCYLAHWPDPDTAHAETLEAFDRLKQAGKIRAYGCSNFDRPMMEAATSAAQKLNVTPYQVLQPEYNLYDRGTFEGPLAEYCSANEIGVITYFSLASGFLTGKYGNAAETEKTARAHRLGKYFDARGQRLLSTLADIAAETGRPQAELALAWLRARPGVTAPIASATSARQLHSLIAAATLTLSDDARTRLTEAGEA
ncbi:aldo/keto reductase [Pseudooceanicola aestuarii]|uniref:aldo/keto reductase n=1 Tax=Pseudooceanicola aestuarii TaxID=2697319 RepID=UPI0013D13E1F|nr:aldo/keto reductase [Pseudooceanicola aestuarii]